MYHVCTDVKLALEGATRVCHEMSVRHTCQRHQGSMLKQQWAQGLHHA